MAVTLIDFTKSKKRIIFFFREFNKISPYVWWLYSYELLQLQISCAVNRFKLIDSNKVQPNLMRCQILRAIDYHGRYKYVVFFLIWVIFDLPFPLNLKNMHCIPDSCIYWTCLLQWSQLMGCICSMYTQAVEFSRLS